mgnify:CR=1 FL=1
MAGLSFHGTTMSHRLLTLPTLALLLCCAVFSVSTHARQADDGGGDGASRAARASRGLIGQPAPAAVLRTLDGAAIDLGALYGKKPVYLKFWATWCTICLEQMPEFARLHARYRGQIEIVAVNAGFSETDAAVRAYRNEHKLAMPVAIDDGSLGRKLNLRVTHQHVVIGPDGRILHIGHKHDKQLIAALDLAAARTGAAAPPLASSGTSPSYRQGEKVSGFTLTTIDGMSAALGRPGRIQALVFFSPWCESYLRESRPRTAQACQRVRRESERLARSSEADWFGISGPVWSSSGELAEYAKVHKTRIPLALDSTGEIFAAFGIRDMPSVVLLDGSARIARVLGPDDRDLEQALRSLRRR